MKGKNSTSDKEVRFFSFEEAFLSAKNYKIIFYICITIVLCRIAIFVSVFLGWQLAEWQKVALKILFVSEEVMALCVIVLIPVMLVLRILLGYLLEKNIQKLEEEISKRNKTSYLRDQPSKEG